jgi:hypothetical protein
MKIDPTETVNCYGARETRYQIHGKTWLEAECLAYPNGGFTRRAYVEIVRNRHNAVALPYGQFRIVRVSIPDTFSTIPARVRYQGKTIAGYVSTDTDRNMLTFTPEAGPGEHDMHDACAF